MTTLFKLAAVAVFAVSASAEAGLYQCDALGNPSRIDQCYARELRTMTTDIHLFYTGMDYARTNITGPEIRYLLDNNGWPAYRAAKCNGDVRCEYDLFAVEYRRIQAKRAKWNNGGDKMAELRANIAAGRYPITTETRLLPQKARFVLAKPEPKEPTRAEVLAELEKKEIAKREAEKAAEEAAEAKKPKEPFRCVRIDGSVHSFTVHDDVNGKVLHTVKPSTRGNAAVAEVTQSGWALLVGATEHLRGSKLRNGLRMGWVREADLNYVNEGCDPVYEVVYDNDDE